MMALVNWMLSSCLKGGIFLSRLTLTSACTKHLRYVEAGLEFGAGRVASTPPLPDHTSAIRQQFIHICHVCSTQGNTHAKGPKL